MREVPSFAYEHPFKIFAAITANLESDSTYIECFDEKLMDPRTDCSYWDNRDELSEEFEDADWNENWRLYLIIMLKKRSIDVYTPKYCNSFIGYIQFLKSNFDLTSSYDIARRLIKKTRELQQVGESDADYDML